MDGANISDEEGDSPPMTQVAKCLRDAGSYDPSMSNSEMLQLYQVLNHSKTTATAEDEHRRTNADANSNYDFIDEMRIHSVPIKKSEHSDLHESHVNVSETSISQIPTLNFTNSSDENVNPRKRLNNDNDGDNIDVFNCAPTKHPPLPLISYKPKYNPPLYCDPKFRKLNLEERKRLLTEHHKKLIQIYDSYQRKSQIYAPLGKPIQPDINFNGTLLKADDTVTSYDFEDEDLFTEDNISDIYITKTGRQTKRKLYTESLNDSWKNKSPSHNNQDSPTGSISKRRNISAMSNDQIMKRSKIFSPTAERLFDKLKEKEEQEKEAKKENKKFIDSLDHNSDDDYVDDSTDVAELVHSEEPFINRRIVPPNPMKGKRRGRGGKSKTNIAKNTNKKAASSFDVEMEDKSQASTSSKMGTCPICSLEFAQDILATHADKCIDTFEQKDDTSSTILFNGSNKITCENCDKVLPFNTDYEVHVRECLAKST